MNNNKRDLTLRLIATSIRKTLQINKSIRIHVLESSVNDKDTYRIVLELPREDCFTYLKMWASWKNAYKYRKR